MKPRLRKWLLGSLLLVGIPGGFLAWQRLRPLPVIPPSLPAGLSDPEIRDALESQRKTVQSKPDSAKDWGELAMRFNAHAFHPEADACYAQAMRLNPTECRWPYLRGIFLLGTDPQAAIGYLQQALERAKGDGERSALRMRLVETLLDANRFDEAEQFLREEEASTPNHPRLAMNRGALALWRDQLPEAEAFFQQALPAPAARKKAAIALATIAYRQGNATQAQSYQAIANSIPQDALWENDPLIEISTREVGRRRKLQQADALTAARRYEPALALYRECFATQPDELTRMKIGSTLAEMGQFAEAESELRSLLEQNPAHGMARFYLGIVFLGQSEQLTQRGQAESAQKKLTAAIQELQQSAVSPSEQGLADLYRARAYRILGQLPEAESAARQAIAARPELVGAYRELAVILEKQGKMEEARQASATADGLTGSTKSPK
ncbi:tetratricopeptide repeat protein [Tuwongella immobilis]|uniref:Tetratricopeptide repeat protein n=1 Tax=Tuwongella immobilis TaxID=692036 RepID=A0A6C2YI27_9BACT|nr:tetratricopeptide repeat protein [Tuwongella immobilis]VIP00715.1 tetratricopeptide tpr_1 repeat-containing protein : Tetratricopeptide TPR_1 repeat-containing protein OS=Thioalkalivibrio nitratireducens (strain DSM 14787 / UNIQEM 213 / ALEN2) GN=TVNIR_1305 PE=4 SV=1: TPR_19: TPR_2 [Tuwongella immobilis]VTR96848.1 tetratricopeptide tpr_1 repeat-containing protein : Tetratricopeptide TPR_1 repeat-containing protein OS=Thioalkalivibrio nitratireducens (strain DSM 14787 / UNIQEM 213 / ALEN2) GN=T